MRKLSIGGGLVLRQSLFLLLLAAFGAYGLYLTNGLRNSLGQALMPGPVGREALLAASAQAEWLSVALIGGVAAICLFTLAVVVPLIHSTVTAPIEALARQISLVANGSPVAISGQDRPDEIGAIAQALARLQTEMARNADLTVEIDHRNEREARLVREAAVREGVAAFSQDLNGLTSRFADLAQTMKDQAEVMASTMKGARTGSASATTAAGAAAADVTAVATASEQLLFAIEEISRQVVEATKVIRDAVAQTQTSASGMARLSTAAGKVGDVVQLISRIAAQTTYSRSMRPSRPPAPARRDAASRWWRRR